MALAEFIVGPTDDPRVRELEPLYEGDYAASLKKAMPAGVAERVSFVGPVPYFELLNHYRSAGSVYASVGERNSKNIRR